jgi:hypothetical protein
VFRNSFARAASLLTLLFLASCGGGGGSSTSPSSGQTDGGAQVGQTTTTSADNQTTTSSSTTTTSASGNGSTTSTAGTTTTTNSGTTTTVSAGLPPLASTKTVLTYGSTLGTQYWSEGDTANGGQGQSFGQTDCVPYEWMSKNYFVKPHISIFLDGNRLAVPRYIGLLSGCIYEIHNHDMSGVFHVFGTAYKYHTLGDLFNIWGQPLTWTNVAGITGKPIAIYVENNGVLRQQTGNPGDIELTDHASITIQIGTPLREIPTYDWSQYPADE